MTCIGVPCTSLGVNCLLIRQYLQTILTNGLSAELLLVSEHRAVLFSVVFLSEVHTSPCNCGGFQTNTPQRCLSNTIQYNTMSTPPTAAAGTGLDRTPLVFQRQLLLSRPAVLQAPGTERLVRPPRLQAQVPAAVQQSGQTDDRVPHG